MTEYTETFELVLYYNRRAVVKPSEPVFEQIQSTNLDLDTDGVLDLYSDLKNKYKVDMKRLRMIQSYLNMYVFLKMLISLKRLKRLKKNLISLNGRKHQRNLLTKPL